MSGWRVLGFDYWGRDDDNGVCRFIEVWRGLSVFEEEWEGRGFVGFFGLFLVFAWRLVLCLFCSRVLCYDLDGIVDEFLVIFKVGILRNLSY